MLYIDISWTIIYVQEPNIDALSAAKNTHKWWSFEVTSAW